MTPCPMSVGYGRKQDSDEPEKLEHLHSFVLEFFKPPPAAKIQGENLGTGTFLILSLFKF